jgi:hypothetical protein
MRAPSSTDSSSTVAAGIASPSSPRTSLAIPRARRVMPSAVERENGVHNCNVTPGPCPTAKSGHRSRSSGSGYCEVMNLGLLVKPVLDDRLFRIYLQDHHAAAAAGVDLAGRLERHGRNGKYGRELSDLAKQLASNRDELTAALQKVGVKSGPTKTMLARLGERLSRLKPNGATASYSPLDHLIALETLATGITPAVPLGLTPCGQSFRPGSRRNGYRTLISLSRRAVRPRGADSTRNRHGSVHVELAGERHCGYLVVTSDQVQVPPFGGCQSASRSTDGLTGGAARVLGGARRERLVSLGSIVLPEPPRCSR